MILDKRAIVRKESLMLSKASVSPAEKIKLDRNSEKTYGDLGYEYVINLNTDRPEGNDFTEFLIHELLHLSHPYNRTIPCTYKNLPSEDYKRIEKDIVEAHEWIFNNCPVLSGFLKWHIETRSIDLKKYLERRRLENSLTIAARKGREAWPSLENLTGKQLLLDF